jgi:Protein of unknown function (DUF2790)
MNTKFLYLLLAIASTAVQAGEQSMTSMQDATGGPIVEYRYGMQLDIAKVLSTSTTPGCDIGLATLKYLDHAGEMHVVRYQAFNTDCHDN